MGEVSAFAAPREGADRMTSKATDYKRQFNAEKYDRMEITVPKGQKEMIKKHAQEQGKSVNRFVSEAINEKIERDKVEEEQP